MLKIGDKVPDFKGVDQEGKEIKYSDYKGKKLIIYFYPKASTPGCTSESCNLSDHNTELQNLGYKIIGISADKVEKQKKFHDKYSFKFPLIADENKEIINAFGVWGKKKCMGKEFDGILRTTFIINEEGIITDVITKVSTGKSAQQILEILTIK